MRSAHYVRQHSIKVTMFNSAFRAGPSSLCLRQKKIAGSRRLPTSGCATADEESEIERERKRVRETARERTKRA